MRRVGSNSDAVGERSLGELLSTPILVLDDEEVFARMVRRRLLQAGFQNVSLVHEQASALARMHDCEPGLLLADIHLGPGQDGLDFVRAIRARGYSGAVVVVSADSSPDELFRAAMAGATDYMVKGRHFDIADEIAAVLRQRRACVDGRWQPGALASVGFLRTSGLTPREIDELQVYAAGFPRYQALAERLERSEVQVRKDFSRILRKLGLDSLSQLTYLLTVCGVMRSHG